MMNARQNLVALLWSAAVFGLVCSWSNQAVAEPGIQVSLGGSEASQVSTALKMLAILTILSLAPAIVLATTSFVRITIVLAFIRTALGIQNMPPSQVLMGLALFLTVAIMTPVGTELYEKGLGPYFDGDIEIGEAIQESQVPLRRFMLGQTRENDLSLFYEINQAERPNGPEDVGLNLLIPAFMLSELRTSFEMGFMILIPFLLLDMLVASVLMSMGMVMLPPALISLPIKVMVFVVSDGWHLLVGSLVRSFE